MTARSLTSTLARAWALGLGRLLGLAAAAALIAVSFGVSGRDAAASSATAAVTFTVDPFRILDTRTGAMPNNANTYQWSAVFGVRS